MSYELKNGTYRWKKYISGVKSPSKNTVTKSPSKKTEKERECEKKGKYYNSVTGRCNIKSPEKKTNMVKSPSKKTLTKSSIKKTEEGEKENARRKENTTILSLKDAMQKNPGKELLRKNRRMTQIYRN